MSEARRSVFRKLSVIVALVALLVAFSVALGVLPAVGPVSNGALVHSLADTVGGLPDAGPCETIRNAIHLAAQANVRYALDNPRAYVESNVAGHLNVLEYCRHAEGFEKLVYASSSSVYGARNQIPFREDGETVVVPHRTGPLERQYPQVEVWLDR